MRPPVPPGHLLYFCTDHDGHDPVGVAAVIVARHPDEARALLDAALMARGLRPHADAPYTLHETYFDRPGAVVLLHGAYC